MDVGLQVRRLGEADRASIAAHLLGLDEDGLRCRFMGRCTREARQAYAASMDLDTVLAFGGFMGDRLVGIAEVHPFGDAGRAELALSVDVSARGHGIGTSLLAQALQAAASSGLRHVEARCMPLNRAMRSLMNRRMAATRVLGPDEAVAEIALAA